MATSLVIFLLLSLFHSTFEQQQQEHVALSSWAERAALLRLRSSLGLRSKEWPIKSDPCSNWVGILCQNGSVIGINISGFTRTRIGNQNPQFSVDSLANFTNLVSFNASRFSLPGSIPNWLGFQIQTLRVLDLRFCKISGAIPFSFGNFSNLNELYLSDNALTGTIPSSLGQLSRLSVLDLSRNSLTGILPDALWALPNLNFLDVSVNNFTGFLSNFDLNVNFTSMVFNLSHNMFYGHLTLILRRVSSVDLSYNFLQGTIPNYARGIASLNRNCLRNSLSQRNVQECARFYSQKGLPFDNFGLPNSTIPPKSDKSKRKVLLLAVILGGVGLILLIIVVAIVLIVCSRKRSTTSQRGTGVGPVLTNTSQTSLGVSLNLSNLGKSFTYQQIFEATGEFSDDNLIRHGHSGDLFRGVLEGRVPVVVKKINLGSGKNDNYMKELDFFGKFLHHRLIPIVGHCLDNENGKFIVYKYMPNGDLLNSLYRKNDWEEDSLQSLDWITRLKIATGAAEGLCYMHHECTPPLVHRDIQASSILLDDKYEVRLGSLTEVCAQDVEIHSNRITRLLRLPQTSEQGAASTCAYDVYCFGKVLLELVTGKLGISASNDPTMKKMLEGTLAYIDIYDKELVTNIVDPSLIIDEDLLEEVWAMAVVAKSCLNPKPSKRPLMRNILKALENPMKVVREETASSAKLRATFSRASWNAAGLFGSWRRTSADVAVAEGMSGSHSGSGGGDRSSRRHSKDVFPEPLDRKYD